LTFLSLNEYLKIAENLIMKKWPNLIYDTENVGEIAAAIMRADNKWEANKGATLNTLRVFYAKRAVSKILRRKSTIISKKTISLNTKVGNTSLIKVLAQKEQHKEDVETLRSISFLTENADLTDAQKRHIDKVFYNSMSLADIAREEKVSRQDIYQSYHSALNKLKRTAGIHGL